MPRRSPLPGIAPGHSGVAVRPFPTPRWAGRSRLRLDYPTDYRMEFPHTRALAGWIPTTDDPGCRCYVSQTGRCSRPMGAWRTFDLPWSTGSMQVRFTLDAVKRTPAPHWRPVSTVDPRLVPAGGWTAPQRVGKRQRLTWTLDSWVVDQASLLIPLLRFGSNTNTHTWTRAWCRFNIARFLYTTFYCGIPQLVVPPNPRHCAPVFWLVVPR